MSGVLLAVSFPPFPLPFVSCVALIPVLRHSFSQADTRKVYLDFFFVFLILFAITFSWPLRHPFTNTAFASLSGVLLLPMSMALPFAAGNFVQKKAGYLAGAVACCAFFLTVESFWTHGPLAMPGTLLGHSLAHAPYIRQMADVSGVAGLSLWVLTFNFIYTGLWLAKNKRIRKKLLLCAIVLLFFPLLYGLIRLNTLPQHHTTTRVALVQPAVPSILWTDEYDGSRITQLIQLTDSLHQTAMPPALVIWPETALPLVADNSNQHHQHLSAWLQTKELPLLAGAILPAPDATGPTAFTNSAVLHRDSTRIRYNKNKLVPFAERVPFENLTRKLGQFRVDAGGVAGYQPGHSQNTMAMPDANLGVLICFESLFGGYTRKYIKEGADFLVALSNIGWWGSRFAPAQYLAFSTLRAIETRRALAINTVSGPGLVVDQTGDTIANTTWMQRTVVDVDIPHYRTTSVYATFGDWLSILALLISIGLVCYLALPYISTITGRKTN
ncbi:MAG: apolipoprotein N-acyltransferase [Bacteroidota bacterium]